MTAHVRHYALYRIINTPVSIHPFPHIYVRDVFPADFYRELRAHLPPPEAFNILRELPRVSKEYSESRLVLPVTPEQVEALHEPLRTFWSWFGRQFLTGEFMQLMLTHFRAYLGRGGEGELAPGNTLDEALIVQDRTTYALEPHTDIPTKVLSFLFYLPADDSMPNLGTSIYAPKTPGFTCTNGKHYPVDGFHLVTTMPYVPNSLFAFARTDSSFHGVEPIQQTGVRRDLLLYDIKSRRLPEQEQASNKTPAVRFQF